MTFAIHPDTDVLIVVDVQNDFCPGGALAVPDGDAVVPVANRLARRFDHVILTQDWHPRDHASFASQHPGHQPFETIELSYGSQTLWPVHCVQGTYGAALHAGLDIPHVEKITHKGFRREIDSYSAFFENDHTTSTGLGDYLQAQGYRRVVLCGLATDFCVNYSAQDARRLGFEAVVVLSGCRAIDLGGSLAAAKAAMAAAGVQLLDDLP